MYERLLYLLKKNNMDKKELATKLNINLATIYSWQRKKPNSETIIKLSKILKTTTDFILLGTNEEINEKEKILIKKVEKNTNKNEITIKIILEINE